MLDQEVDPLVLQRVAWPENLASAHVRAAARPTRVRRATTELRMLDMTGRLVDAKVTWVRTIRPGPAPQCGYLVQPDFPVRMPLDGPLLPADWTAEINYLANSDGSMMLSLTEGDEVKVPVRPGLNRVYRAAARCRGRDHRAGEHRRAVGVPGLGSRRFRGTDVVTRPSRRAPNVR